VFLSVVATGAAAVLGILLVALFYFIADSMNVKLAKDIWQLYLSFTIGGITFGVTGFILYWRTIQRRERKLEKLRSDQARV
jgi:O-antigen/teichoic acid export membrane protein